MLLEYATDDVGLVGAMEAVSLVGGLDDHGAVLLRQVASKFLL